MEPTDSQLRLALERLDAEAEWPRFVADRERSFVELAEAISRLEGKFEHLADVAVLFSPVRRFVLDRLS